MTISLLEDIAAGQSLVAVDNPTEASLDDVFVLDSERVVVRNRPRAGGKLILGRGVLGTDRAAHSTGATLTTYSPSEATPGAGVLVDEAPYAPGGSVTEGDRFAETLDGESRVFEATNSGTNTPDAPWTDFTISLLPLGVTTSGDVDWRYIGIVGAVPWTDLTGVRPEQWDIDAAGNLGIDSGSTPDDGDPVLSIHVAEEATIGGLLEISSDGQADYAFQDAVVGGPIFFDFHRTDPSVIVVRIGSELFTVIGLDGETPRPLFEAHIDDRAVRVFNDAGTGYLLEALTSADALGFFGATPVARPEVPVIPTAQDVVDALVALGLVTQAAP